MTFNFLVFLVENEHILEEHVGSDEVKRVERPVEGVLEGQLVVVVVVVAYSTVAESAEVLIILNLVLIWADHYEE
jgi:hypothetical protein